MANITNKQYLHLFNNSRDGMYRSTPEGKYIDANPALVKMLGYNNKQELMKTSIPQDIYYNSNDRPDTNKKNKTFTTTLQKKDGTSILVEINSWVIKDDNDNLYHEGIIRDLSQRQHLFKELHYKNKELEITLESIGDGVIVTDFEGKIQMMNQVAEDLTGWKEIEAKETHLKEIFKVVNEQSRKPVNSPVKKVLNSGKIEGLANHTILIAKDGTEKAIADSAAPITNTNGKLLGVVMVFRDVTKKRETIRKLKASEQKYRSVFENTGTAMMIVEKDTTLSRVNKQMVLLSGYSRNEIENKMSWTDFVADENQLQQMLEYHHNRRQPETQNSVPRTYEFKFIDKNNKLKDVMLNIDIIPGTNKTVASLMDITERKQQEQKIRYLGYHDELTGLYNRHYFNESLERLDSERQLPLSIIGGDVNGLKLINDAFGHKKGDELLKKAANMLSNCCRQEDIVARWGGDEFFIILPQTSPLEAKKVCDRINHACKKNSSEMMEISIALGCATKTDPETDIEEIINKAEKMVYQHKLVESESIRSSIISSLEETLREKDLETREHASRIKKLAVTMGKKLELSNNQIDKLKLIASLHDIGKIAISENILLKPTSLTKEEWKTMKKHPEIGYRIAQASSELTPIAEGILHHHEWWNGSGYPQGLKEDEIPLISRIIAIVDAYDVMTHTRPYKEAKTKTEAINEIKRCSGKQFDPYLVDKFLEIIEDEII